MKKIDVKNEKSTEIIKKNNNFIFNAFIYNWLYDLMHKHDRFLDGNEIPKELEMELDGGSGFFFGMETGRKGFIGKPAYEDGHILVVGYPGSGKTMAIVIPSIMTWKGILIIVDVKGNLHNYWKRLNKHTGKKVKLFKPGALNNNTCRYDPFAFLRYDSVDNLAGNANDLALALIPLPPSAKELVWIQTAQVFLTGAIIFYFELGYSFNETMVAIQRASIIETVELIMKGKNEIAKLYMSKLGEVNEKVIVNIGMELSKLAVLVTDPAIINAFSPETDCGLLDWQELNTATEPFDIIIEIPEANLDKWESMTLLMINQLIKSLERRPERTYVMNKELPPILIMLDEFPRLGKITTIQNGLATLRSRGVTFSLLVQSIANLEKTYGTTDARVIADICSYKVILGISDPESQDYFSKAVGTKKFTQKGVNVNLDPFSKMFTSLGLNVNENREPFIFPHEFLTLKDVVLLNPFNGFCRADKILFYKHQDLFLEYQLLKHQENEGYATSLAITNCEGDRNND